jgi:hypothetical protein
MANTTYLWLYVKVNYQIWSQQPNLRCLHNFILFFLRKKIKIDILKKKMNIYAPLRNGQNHVFTLHHSMSSPLADEKATPE